jgi:uncharacterized repeat protein (TIGR01451 family)
LQQYRVGKTYIIVHNRCNWRLKMKRIISLLAVFVLLTAFVPTVAFAHTAGGEKVVDLIAGRHIDVGSVKVWNDKDNLYVKYMTNSYWCLDETHLQVASSLDDIPQANGNPIPGQFEYQNTKNCAPKFIYTIPLTGESCDFYIAAHAVVKKVKSGYYNDYKGRHSSSTETAWGDGFDFPGKNWATYFKYSVEGCVVPSPSLSLTKAADPSTYSMVDQLITYSYVIENTGNVDLAGPFSVTDDKTSVSCEQPDDGTLSPGETMNCSASYSITQADLDAGSVTNTASASGEGVTSPEATATVTSSIPNPNLSLNKEGVLDMTVVAPSDQADMGDVINYTLTATNDGNVSLTNVTITDPLLGTLSCTPPQPASLAPGESLVCTGSYILTETDISNGSVENTATVTSDQTSPVSDTNITTILQSVPHISLTKSTTTTSYDQVGQFIDYTMVATNDGNVSLTDVSISDPLIGTLNCTQPVTLDPGESLTCTGTRTVTQADLDAGSITNTATVSGTDPDNNVVTDGTSQTVNAASTCQPTVVTADFSQLAPGDSVEGVGVVAPYLDIGAKGTAVKVVGGATPFTYGAPNDNPITNGALAVGGGFSDTTAQAAGQAHQYTFTFAGVTISDFSLHMLDYGDWNYDKSTTHSVSLIAYDVNGTVIAQQELSYTSDAIETPRASSIYGDLYLTGDAVTASPGQPGNWTWALSQSGIAKVALEFGPGYDPNIAFDTLAYNCSQ